VEVDQHITNGGSIQPKGSLTCQRLNGGRWGRHGLNGIA
jgi:hypothetical protein